MFKFKKKDVIYPVIFVCLVLLLSSLTPVFRPPILNILKYPFYFLTLVRREIGGIIFYHRNFIQNERLKKEIGFLKQKLNAQEETYLENKRLKQLLAFKQKTSYKVIAARVIGASADNWSSAIIIDKGSASGIKRGYVSVTYLGLVGRVIEVAESSSKILLMNDKDFGVSGIVQRSRQEGLVSGNLGSNLIMKYLPKDCDIKVDDVILTSGLTEAFPKGLLIGTVTDIGEELSGLTRYCLIKPAVNLSNIEELFIIIP